MKKNHYIMLILLLLSACKVAEKEADSVPLFQVGDMPVSREDFIYVYEKNNYNNKDLSDKEEIRNYLDLYINFKLKIKEAEELGLSKSEAFKEELDGYKKQLAKPYLTESQVTDQLVEEAYERLKQEIRAAHILISVSPEAAPEDTLKAYKRIQDIRERVQKGEDFTKLAEQYSEDPSAKTNGGDLGYFSALQMVYPFEEAAYSTQVGQVSEPVRTRFGYHILKVKDKRPSRGKVKVSHIMIRATEGISEEDSILARNKIYEIYKQLEAGAPWEDLVQQHSEDVNTRTQGGSLPWFGTGNMIPEFEEAAFKLDQEKDISEPVKTAYGWHIIRLDEKKGLESFEELSPSLKAKVAKDSRSELNKIALIKRLKEENNVKENQDVFEKVVKGETTKPDTGVVTTNIEDLSEVLFTIGDSAFTVQNFNAFYNKNLKTNRNSINETFVRQQYNKFLEESLLAYEEAHLESKYDEYRLIVNEYREGILLFQLMDEKVWSKALVDTAGLQQFFEKNRDNYRWNERLDAQIFNAANEGIIEKIKPLLKTEFLALPGEDLTIRFSNTKTDINEQDKEKIISLAKKAEKNPDHLFNITTRFPQNDKAQRTAKIDEIIALFEQENISQDRILINHQVASNSSVTLELGGKPSRILDKIFNRDQALSLKIEEGMFEKDSTSILNEIPWEVGTYTVKKDDRVYYIVVNKVLPSALKELNEIRGLVISDYQNYLEKEWVQSLKNKYSVQVNESSLEKVYQKFENN